MMLAPTIRCVLALALLAANAGPPSQPTTRVVKLIAERNSTFRLEGANTSQLDLSAGEVIVLHVVAYKARSMNRDGSVHGLVLLDAHQRPVPGWELLFKPGAQDIEVTAPGEPGIYQAVCSVICSPDHEHMKFRVVVRAK